MSDDFVKRAEYNESIGRMHDKVNDIDKTATRIEESVKHMEKFTGDMHKLLYGNGQDGFITRVDKKFTQLFERVSLHTKILSVVTVAVVGTITTAVVKLIVR